MEVSRMYIPEEDSHRPLITFIPAESITQTENIFEAEVRESPVYTPFSELRLVRKRPDMKERFIDTSSDHSYSLYRCLSKEIFGAERHYHLLVELVVAEVRYHPKHYGKIYGFRRASKLKDIFKFSSTIEKENAEFYADRIEDGLNLEDLELLAVSTYFQCPIFILFVHQDGTSSWREFTPVRRIRKPADLDTRIHRSKCEPMMYYVTLLRTSYGQFHRIVPGQEVCNCLLEYPTKLEVQMETLYIRQDSNGKLIYQL